MLYRTMQVSYLIKYCCGIELYTFRFAQGVKDTQQVVLLSFSYKLRLMHQDYQWIQS